MKHLLMGLGGSVRHMVEQQHMNLTKAMDASAKQMHWNTGMSYEACQGLVSYAFMWARNGFSSIQVPHKLAASLMTTSLSQELLSTEVRVPWDGFLFNVPSNILNDREWLILTTAGGFAATDGQMVIRHNASGDLSNILELETDKFQEGLDHFSGSALPPIDQVTRYSLLISRLMVGVCLEIGYYRASEHTAEPYEHVRRDERNTSVFRLTRPVQLDTRESVCNYIRGGGTTPTVQSLVRGHWKRQPCGLDKTDRKLIHIEPYWRGPEDAPVAVRPHVLEAF